MISIAIQPHGTFPSENNDAAESEFPVVVVFELTVVLVFVEAILEPVPTPRTASVFVHERLPVFPSADVTVTIAFFSPMVLYVLMIDCPVPLKLSVPVHE